jgi:hypothetical protein
VALEERERLCGEWAVQRVHQRRVQAVGKGQAGEPAVVVDDIEGLGGGVDGIEGARDVIGLIDRLLDLVGVPRSTSSPLRSCTTCSMPP